MAIDLDGTLLHDDQSLGVASAQAIALAVERGIRVVLATGRAPRAVRDIHAALGLDTLIICHNGALIVDPASTRPFFHQALPPDTARHVVQLLRARDPAVALAVEVEDRCFAHLPAAAATGPSSPTHAPPGPDAGREEAAVLAFFRSEPTLPRVPQNVPAFEPLYKQGVTKIIVGGEPGRLANLQAVLAQQLHDRVSFSFTHMRLLQVVAPGVDKAVALDRVARHYHVPLEHSMAVGDAPNDLPMLRAVGLAVAMGNAWDDVARAAHFTVSSNNDDGVALAIRRHALGIE